MWCTLYSVSSGYLRSHPSPNLEGIVFRMHESFKIVGQKHKQNEKSCLPPARNFWTPVDSERSLSFFVIHTVGRTLRACKSVRTPRRPGRRGGRQRWLEPVLPSAMVLNEQISSLTFLCHTHLFVEAWSCYVAQVRFKLKTILLLHKASWVLGFQAWTVMTGKKCKFETLSNVKAKAAGIETAMGVVG